MTTLIEPILAGRVRPLVDSRPPAAAWVPADQPAPSNTWQPPLDLAEPGTDPDPSAQPTRRHVVRAKWTVRRRPDLPDAAEWSASLALAVMQTVLMQRPVTQLNRWLEEDVLVALTMHQRLRRRAAEGDQPRARSAVTVTSVRVQHPAADVAEVTALLMVGRRPAALAFRLEALESRWLCTALELGPRAEPERHA